MSNSGESERSSSGWVVVDQLVDIQDEDCSSNSSSIELLDDDDNDEVENGEDNLRNSTLISSLAPKFILRISKKQHQVDNPDFVTDEMSNITKEPVADETATEIIEDPRTDEMVTGIIEDPRTDEIATKITEDSMPDGMTTKITEDQLVNYNNSVPNSVQHSSNPSLTTLGGGKTGPALAKISIEDIEAFRQTIEDLKVSLLPVCSRQCSKESVEMFKDQMDKQNGAYSVQLAKSSSVPFDTFADHAIDSMQSSVSSSYSVLTRDTAAEAMFVSEKSTDRDGIEVPFTLDCIEHQFTEINVGQVQVQPLELNQDREDGLPLSTKHVEQDVPMSPAIPMPTAMWHSFSVKSRCAIIVAIIVVIIQIAVAYRLSNGYQDPKQNTEYLKCRTSLNMVRQANTDLIAQVGKLRYSDHSSGKDPVELNKDPEYKGQSAQTQWAPKEQSNTLEISSKLESLEKEKYRLVSENKQLKRVVEKMEHYLNESISRRKLSLDVPGNDPDHVTVKNCLTVLAQQYKHGHFQCLHSLSCINRILNEYTADSDLQQDSELHNDDSLNKEPEKDHHNDGNVKMDTENLIKETNEFMKDTVNHKHSTDQSQTKENKVDNSWSEESKSQSSQTSEQPYDQSGGNPKEPYIDHHTISNTWGILTDSLFDAMNKTQKQIQRTWEKVQNMSTTIWRNHEPSLVKLKHTFSKKLRHLSEYVKIKLRVNRWFKRGTNVKWHSKHHSAHPNDASHTKQTPDNTFKDPFSDNNIFIQGIEEIGFKMCQLNFHKFKKLLANKQAALVQFQSNLDKIKNMYQTTENRILANWLECQTTWWSSLDSPMIGDDCIKYLYCWQVKVANGDVRLCHKWKKNNLHAFEDSCSLWEMLESIETSIESNYDHHKKGQRVFPVGKDGKCFHDAKSNANFANTDTENKQSLNNQKPNMADEDDKLYEHVYNGQTNNNGPEDDEEIWDSEDDWYMARAKEREYLHQEPDDWYFRRNKKGKFADSATTFRR